MEDSTGARRATIVDVAREAGVSRAAVSKVIRNADGVSSGMRAKVQLAIDQLEYRPSSAARAMRGASFTLGMEVPHLTNTFLAEIADGARQALSGTPYQLVVAPAEGSERGAIEALVDHRVDGIIAISPMVRPAWLEQVADRVPLVMVGRHDAAVHYDTVVGDDVHGAREAMAHLLDLGHRRIVHLTEGGAVTAEGSGTPHALRLQAYRECMRAGGLAAEVRVVHIADDQEARAATASLLHESPRPTAVFAGHDALAMGALAGVAEAGLTAADVSVIGYDNTRLAAHPLISLTSVDQSGPELGRHAVEMLLGRLHGRTAPRRHTITPSLVVRRSTAPPPRAGDR